MSHGLPSSLPSDSLAASAATISILVSHFGYPQRKREAISTDGGVVSNRPRSIPARNGTHLSLENCT
jgi:hypothetical protein